MALELLEKAASAQNPSAEALTILGTVYETGGLVCKRSGKMHPLIKNQSKETALRFYQDAAKMGCIQASNHLGKLSYQSGDLKAAANHFKRAAEANDKLGQFNLATCYELGYAKFAQLTGVKPQPDSVE